MQSQQGSTRQVPNIVKRIQRAETRDCASSSPSLSDSIETNKNVMQHSIKGSPFLSSSLQNKQVTKQKTFDSTHMSNSFGENNNYYDNESINKSDIPNVSQKHNNYDFPNSTIKHLGQEYKVFKSSASHGNREISVNNGDVIKFIQPVTYWLLVENKTSNKTGYIPADSLLEQNKYKEAIVKYPYSANNDDELSLKEGDVVTVNYECQDGWFHVEIDSKKGWFPANFLQFSDKLSKETGSTQYETVLTHNKACILDKRTDQSIIENTVPDSQTYVSSLGISKDINLVDEQQNLSTTSDAKSIEQPDSFDTTDVLAPFEYWFHGIISREESEHILQETKEPGTFLVRQRNKDSNSLCITVYSLDKVRHFQIKKENDYYVCGFEKHPTIEGIVHLYMKNPLAYTTDLQPVILVKPCLTKNVF